MSIAVGPEQQLKVGQIDLSTARRENVKWITEPLETILAAAGIVLLHFVGLLAETPLTTLLGLFALAVFSASLANWRLVGTPSRATTHVFVAIQLFSLTALLYATGWGPVLAAGYVFPAAQLIQRLGAKATWPALLWSIAGVIFGQAGVSVGVFPTKVVSEQSAAAALIGVVAVAFTIRMIGAAIKERDKSLQLLRELVDKDPLTGLYNHRALMEAIDRAIAQAGRSGQSLSVLLIDIDRFKRINDIYGHQVGDDVLRSFSSRMRWGLRAMDVLGRYGGEEFLVLLPSTGDANALTVARRLLFEATHEPQTIGGLALEVNASIGVATFPIDGSTREQLIKAADVAMYKAKRQGGARCLAAGDDY